ncbi:SulP family inorganic anion transporter [Curvibacter sp. HBC61]|uniref:SulP family inorganic anion transporter n=1 Tax=Curvibacter cyanobacteriorum TaxID=3026422 RepID=A0ABT5MW54_9BURK|nr:SulP family inorganic anion transporter [Curvibacter sp. HBC61]MDD0838274.1 SulP family inorganic anion transporter [Curvibacter sp. HBC61]
MSTDSVKHLSWPAVSWMDMVAGVSLAGLLASSSIAYARLGELPPQAGLMASVLGLLGYGLLGRSRFAVVAPTSSSATVMAAATASLAGGNVLLQMGLSAVLVIMTGLIFMLAALLHLGRISDFIARPVLRGFTLGLAWVICIKQLPSLVGFTPHASGALPMAWELLTHVPQWQPWSVMVGGLACALLYMGTVFRKLPMAFAVIVLGVLANRLFGWHALGVAEVGAIELTWQRPHWPSLNQTQWRQMAEMSIAVMLMVYGESCTSIRTYSLLKKDPIDSNRDLWALGVSNLASGLFNALPVGAGFSQTSASVVYGAQGKATGWVALLALVVLIVTCLPFLASTPEPVLAAIVIFSMWKSLGWGPLKVYFELRRSRLTAIAAALGAVLFGVLDGLLLGIGISFIMALLQLGKGAVQELGRLGKDTVFVDRHTFPEAEPVPGILVLRPDEGLTFANADKLCQDIRARVLDVSLRPRVLVLSLERSPDLDGGAVESLQELAQSLQEHQVRLIFVRLSASVIQVLEVLHLFGVADEHLSELSVHQGVQQALQSTAAPAAVSSASPAATQRSVPVVPG